MNKLAYFSGSNLETISESPNKVIKKGLVLIEGTHVDSKKRTHTFSPARIREIVSNSNALFAKTRIPVLMDHKKEQSSVIGDVESQFQCTTINEDNFPGADDKGLTGKLGIFVNEIAIKSGDAIRQLNEGLLNTLSPGIDVVSNAIREISATPNPAIANLRLFKRAEFESDALTFDDLENSDDMLDKIRNQYEDLTNKLWELTETIQTIDEQALNGQSREEVQYQAINDFATRFLTLIGSDEEEQDPMMQEANGGSYPNQTPSNQVQGQQQNWGMPPNDPNARYASGLPIAAFSMTEMEAVNRAEFGYRQAVSSVFKDLSRRETTGKTLGQIGSKFKNKLINATKGKLAAGGRLLNKIGYGITGNKTNSSVKLSKSQRDRALIAKTKFGTTPKMTEPKVPTTSKVTLNSSPTAKTNSSNVISSVNRGYRTGSKSIVLSNQTPKVQERVLNARRNKQAIETASTATAGQGFKPIAIKKVKQRK